MSNICYEIWLDCSAQVVERTYDRKTASTIWIHEANGSISRRHVSSTSTVFVFSKRKAREIIRDYAEKEVEMATEKLEFAQSRLHRANSLLSKAMSGELFKDEKYSAAQQSSGTA